MTHGGDSAGNGVVRLLMPRADVVMPACDKLATSALFSAKYTTEKQAAATHCFGPYRMPPAHAHWIQQVYYQPIEGKSIRSLSPNQVPTQVWWEPEILVHALVYKLHVNRIESVTLVFL